MPPKRTDKQRAKEAERKRRYREQRKRNEEEITSNDETLSISIGANSELNFDSESCGKIKDMTVQQKREYNRRKAAERRDRIKYLEVDLDVKSKSSVHSEAGKSSDEEPPMKRARDVTQKKRATPSRKRQRTEEESANDETMTKDAREEETEEPDPSETKNCKVRFGLIDIFQVETDAIVIPHFKFTKKKDESKELTEMRATLSRFNKEQHSKFDQLIKSDESKHELESHGCVHFRWQPEPRSPLFRVRELKRSSFHVTVPSLKQESDFSTVTECRLRAAYLSCLLEADKREELSLAFPILGQNVCPVRSAVIALQTIFAYMHAVKFTGLKLIYIVTNVEKVYDSIGKALSYIREFDLRFWTTEEYLRYEQKIFDRLKEERYFGTIPGTDLVWRCFKLSQQRGRFDKNTKKLIAINNTMAKRTGVPKHNFMILKYRLDDRLFARHYIDNGVGDGVAHSFNMLDMRHRLINFCGSNQILRKVWILSYYHMFFEEHSGDSVEVDWKSDQCKERKKLFNHLKLVHGKIVKIWNDVVEFAPFKCDCKCSFETSGCHEKMIVFLTKLSHPDFVIDEWTLNKNTFIFDSETSQQLNAIPKFKPRGVPRMPEGRKAIFVESVRQQKAKIQMRVKLWMDARTTLFQDQQEKLTGIIDEERLDKAVGEETAPASYNPAEYDKIIESDKDKDKHSKQLMKDFQEADENFVKTKNANDDAEHTEATRDLDKCMDALDANRYIRHFLKDLEQERTLRNRYFRNYSPFIMMLNYPPVPDMDVLEATESLWEKEDGREVSVDEFLRSKLEQLKLQRFNVPFDRPPYDPYDSPDLSFIENTEKDPLEEKYPEPIDIGDPIVPCPFCGALLFEGEKNYSCCKSGAVWIPPIKKLPKEVDQIFDKVHRSVLLEANALFSMASIQYDRVTQARGGVQSFKNKGTISCHPSAIYAWDKDRPAFANFITLNMSNEGIAAERLRRVKGKYNKHLKQIFVDIQKYMDKHNKLYEAYKSMSQIEKELREDEATKDLLENNKIEFRIVPPGELNDDQIKALQAHNGVYARPSRMGKSYVSVAYTWNADDMIPLPRGLKIYPKNPKTPQQPLSIYSDMCDQMSYPLFFPDGVGGWGLHKYPRLNKKTQKNVPTFIERVKAHLEELKEQGENPADYYDLDKDEVIREIVEEMFHKRKTKKRKARADYSHLSNCDDQSRSHSSSSYDDDDNDSIEDDPQKLSEDELMELAMLEHFENEPLNEDEVAYRPNIEYIERGGEIYPFINRKKPLKEIPYVLVRSNPFENLNEDEEDHFEPDDYWRYYEDQMGDEEAGGLSGGTTPEQVVDRYRDGTDDYSDAFTDLNSNDDPPRRGFRHWMNNLIQRFRSSSVRDQPKRSSNTTLNKSI
uniref:ATP-dependent DNA helicase n=1 Tax=Caenorhabditis tropicalis TaxID=1561998 RepID=A0A1I7V062_9PELO